MRARPGNGGKLRGRTGQILIPSLLFFPILMVFAALVFETAKLSREKIRFQMGVDAGAYAEMSNMTDYINRTAYVNGAFPFRIFKESWACDACPECLVPYAQGGGYDCLYDIERKYYGAFPATSDDSAPANADKTRSWNIAYRGQKRGLGDKEYGTSLGGRGISLMEKSSNNLRKQYEVIFYHYPCNNTQDPPPGPNDDTDCGVSKPYAVYSAWKTYYWYVTVYRTLGAVQTAQQSVYEAIAGGNKFLRRGFYLNTGSSYKGDAHVPKVDSNQNKIQNIYYACRTFKPILDYYPYLTCGFEHTDPPENVDLFQSTTLTGIPEGSVKLSSEWKIPSNFFKVEAEPTISCSVATLSAEGSNSGHVNLEQGSPTPHYQTMLSR